MSKLEQFNVDLKALSQGDNILRFVLDDAFFEAIEAPTVRRGRLQTTLTIHRTEDYFDLDFHTEGLVTVACDRCLDDLEQPISADDHLVAKFGTARRVMVHLSVCRTQHSAQACACTWKLQPCHDESARRAFSRPKRCREC